SSRRRHTRSYGDWSSDVCSSDLRDLTHLLGQLSLFNLELPIGGIQLMLEPPNLGMGIGVDAALQREIALEGADLGPELHGGGRRSEERRVGKGWRAGGGGG